MKYSIPVIHLNMADTVEKSLNSILKQVNDNYEIVVVDDGSTDGSLDILRRIEQENEIVKLFELDQDPERTKGNTRNISIQKTNGEYVLIQLDMDDYYLDRVIPKFVNFYHELENELDKDFLACGHGIQMAPRNLLIEYPYEPVNRADDKTIWKKLLDDNKFVKVDMPNARRKIEKDSLLTKFKKISLRIWTSFKREEEFDWEKLEGKIAKAPKEKFNWKRE